MEHKEAVKLITQWASEKKAEKLKIIDVKEKSDYTDTLIICQSTASLHSKAIADHIMRLAKEHKLHILSYEGIENAQWILIDFSDIIVHIFLEEVAEYYKLEDLWKVKKQEDAELEK
jgi:ribosome-associated protein